MEKFKRDFIISPNLKKNYFANLKTGSPWERIIESILRVDWGLVGLEKGEIKNGGEGNPGRK